MLKKLLNARKLALFCVPPKPPSKPLSKPMDPSSSSSSALKIVHVGGTIERYFIATPASKILEKYPSCVLARPLVFKQPWTSIVHSSEILAPGEKLYLVPCRTVKKLRERIKRPNFDDVSNNSQCSSRKKIMFFRKNDSSDSSFSWKKSSRKKKHVSFIGVDVKHKESSSSGVMEKSELKTKTGGSRRMPSSFPAWEPSLTSITESESHID